MENQKTKKDAKQVAEKPVDLPVAQLLQVAGYNRLFRFEPALAFEELDITITPKTGDYIIYKNTQYKVNKVVHNIDTKETKVFCARTHF